jgi:hypothetical protein
MCPRGHPAEVAAGCPVGQLIDGYIVCPPGHVVELTVPWLGGQPQDAVLVCPGGHDADVTGPWFGGQLSDVGGTCVGGHALVVFHWCGGRPALDRRKLWCAGSFGSGGRGGPHGGGNGS